MWEAESCWSWISAVWREKWFASRCRPYNNSYAILRDCVAGIFGIQPMTLSFEFYFTALNNRNFHHVFPRYPWIFLVVTLTSSRCVWAVFIVYQSSSPTLFLHVSSIRCYVPLAFFNFKQHCSSGLNVRFFILEGVFKNILHSSTGVIVDACYSCRCFLNINSTLALAQEWLLCLFLQVFLKSDC